MSTVSSSSINTVIRSVKRLQILYGHPNAPRRSVFPRSCSLDNARRPARLLLLNLLTILHEDNFTLWGNWWEMMQRCRMNQNCKLDVKIQVVLFSITDNERNIQFVSAIFPDMKTGAANICSGQEITKSPPDESQVTYKVLCLYLICSQLWSSCVFRYGRIVSKFRSANPRLKISLKELVECHFEHENLKHQDIVTFQPRNPPPPLQIKMKSCATSIIGDCNCLNYDGTQRVNWL